MICDFLNKDNASREKNKISAYFYCRGVAYFRFSKQSYYDLVRKQIKPGQLLLSHDLIYHKRFFTQDNSFFYRIYFLSTFAGLNINNTTYVNFFW